MVNPNSSDIFEDLIPHNSFCFIVTCTATFLFITFLLEHFKITSVHAKFLAKVNNLTYSVVSLGLLLYGLQLSHNRFLSGWDTTLCHPTDRNSFRTFLQLYKLSKIWEFLDVCLVLLQGFPINLHFRVHHSSTLLTWLSIQTNNPFDAPVMLINCLMHFFLYGYFGGISMFFWVVRILGFVQLLMGVVCSVVVIGLRWIGGVECEGEVWAIVVGLGFYLTYFILFFLEIRGQQKEETKKEE